jgi:glutathione S-transferase
LLPRFEERLQTQDYLMGDYGIADLTFTPFLALAERVGVDLSRFPKTAQWAERLKNRPSYEEVKLGLTA